MSGSPSSARPRVSLVIPAMNEARNLAELLPRIPAEVDELIVVDGRSADETVQTVRELAPDAIVLQQPGYGKGNALAAGFRAARGAFVVMMDADGSNDPAEIPRFVAVLGSGTGYVKGSRFIEGGGSADITIARSLGNRWLRRLVNALYGTRYTDLCYGFNAFRSECLELISVDSEGFEVEALISCQMARAGVALTEVASFEYPRRYGTSNLRPVRDGLRILWIVLRERLRSERLRP